MIAVIPTLGLAPQLGPLVEQLSTIERVGRVLLFVNHLLDVGGPAYDRVFSAARESNADVVFHGGSIYDSWRYGIVEALELGTSCAVLNDDIEIDPHALRLADAALHCSGAAVVGLDYAGYERIGLSWRHGSYRHGGVGGWAFVVDPQQVPDGWDHGYRWWFGDDSLFFSIEAQGGRIAVMEGAHVLHHTSTTASVSPWTEQAKSEDAALFRKHWGNR